MKYKNCGYCAKTFSGITFEPGEIKDVPFSIRDDHFIRVVDKHDVKSSVKVEAKADKPQPKRKYTKKKAKPIIKETPENSSESVEVVDKKVDENDGEEKE